MSLPLFYHPSSFLPVLNISYVHQRFPEQNKLEIDFDKREINFRIKKFKYEYVIVKFKTFYCLISSSHTTGTYFLKTKFDNFEYLII